MAALTSAPVEAKAVWPAVRNRSWPLFVDDVMVLGVPDAGARDQSTFRVDNDAHAPPPVINAIRVGGSV